VPKFLSLGSNVDAILLIFLQEAQGHISNPDHIPIGENGFVDLLTVQIGTVSAVHVFYNSLAIVHIDQGVTPGNGGMGQPDVILLSPADGQSFLQGKHHPFCDPLLSNKVRLDHFCQVSVLFKPQ
jgi:hypothetical protein